MAEESTQATTWTENNFLEIEDRTSREVQCYSDQSHLNFIDEELKLEAGWEQHEQPSEQSISGFDDSYTAAPREVITTSVKSISLQDSGDSIRWLELYDPDYKVLFYFDPQSGEFCWGPLAAKAQVRQCNSNSVLSAVVSLQSAARSHRARAKVSTMRQKRKSDLEKQSISNETGHRGEDIACNDIIYTEAKSKISLQRDCNTQWFEVIDPATQEQYYYNPRTGETRWDPPIMFELSFDKCKTAAAIIIQSLARGHIARNQVRNFRERFPQQFTQHLLKVSEAERCETNESKVLQHQGKELFEGIDDFKHESLETHKTTDSANVIHTLFDFLDFEEEQGDFGCLAQEQAKEDDARIGMQHEEILQCQKGDNFWGIQAEEARQHAANITMAWEETISRRFAETVLEQALLAAWEDERMQIASQERAAYIGLERRMQARYLRWFYHQCVSVDELLDYRWSDNQHQEQPINAASPVKRQRHLMVHLHSKSVASIPHHVGDYDHSKSGDQYYGLVTTLTVHHHNTRWTNGTHFEIFKASPECAFDKATAAKLYMNEIKHHVVSGSQKTKPVTGTSIKYDHFQMPDPHLPARFNGVPYKPNQISPTRDILGGDHRKMNQLPSLAKQERLTKALELRQMTTSAKPNFDALFGPAQQSLKPMGGPRIDQKLDINNASLHAQFTRQEYDILLKIFSLMDVNKNGTVNLNEMRRALQHDAEIHTLAKTSLLLRILLKKHSGLKELFSVETFDEASQSESSNEISWNNFLAGCERSYFRQVSEGFIQAQEAETWRGAGMATSNRMNQENKESSVSEREAQTIRRVFALLDSDKMGVVDVAEMQRSIYSWMVSPPKNSDETGAIFKESQVLVNASRALHLLLHQKCFMTAFAKYEPIDPRGISEEEFVAFCLEVTQIAAANNMVAPID